MSPSPWTPTILSLSEAERGVILEGAETCRHFRHLLSLAGLALPFEARGLALSGAIRDAHPRLAPAQIQQKAFLGRSPNILRIWAPRSLSQHTFYPFVACFTDERDEFFKYTQTIGQAMPRTVKVKRHQSEWEVTDL